MYKTILLLTLTMQVSSSSSISDVDDRIDDLMNQIDTVWIMISAFMVFFMHAGFAMLEMGSVRSKNAMNILIKNLLCITMATLVWYFVGYGIAYGDGAGFLGTSQYAGSNVANYNRDWLFQWAFAGTASTIVSGCLAERCNLWAQVIVSIALTGFIYPVEVHWTWAADGWLTELGQTDFAGSGIVHMMGGVAGLIGAIFLGPRMGKFDKDCDPEEFRPHNVGMVTLGTLILWFGWYGFNGGSALGATGDNNVAIQIVCMNTTLAGATGGLTVFVVKMAVEKVECVSSLSNGLLAGLVAITAGCDGANAPWSIGIGFIGGLLQQGSVRTLGVLEIDDPLDAFSVHGINGLWGVIASGIVRMAVGGAEVKVLTGCLIGAAVIMAWTAVCAISIFLPLKIAGLLRVSPDLEAKGLDEVFHGGLGYQIGESVSRRQSKTQNEQ